MTKKLLFLSSRYIINIKYPQAAGACSAAARELEKAQTE